MSISILTPTGFQEFSGVKCYTHEQSILIKTTGGFSRKCALDHRFIIEGDEVFAKDLNIGDYLADGHHITSVDVLEGCIDLYDPTNVQNGSVYLHDGNIVSHNTFLGTSNTLISSACLLSLQAEKPIEAKDGVRYYELPVEGHKYILTVDVSRGRGQDYSTFTVFDISTKGAFKQVCTFRDNMISPLIFPDIIVKIAKLYNEAMVVIESNDAGQLVTNAVYYEHEYENTYVESMVKKGGIGVTMTKKVKRVGCSNMKDLLEQNKLIVCDPDTIIELSTFVQKGSSYEAREKCHDDMVMNIVLFGWIVSLVDLEVNIDLKQLIWQDQSREIEDNLVPVGIMGNLESQRIEELNPAHAEVVRQQKDWMSW